jgi:hypothetical protein
MSQSWASYHQRLADKFFFPSRWGCRTDPHELTRKRRLVLAARLHAKKISVVAIPETLKP